MRANPGETRADLSRRRTKVAQRRIRAQQIARVRASERQKRMKPHTRRIFRQTEADAVRANVGRKYAGWLAEVRRAESHGESSVRISLQEFVSVPAQAAAARFLKKFFEKGCYEVTVKKGETIEEYRGQNYTLAYYSARISWLKTS